MVNTNNHISDELDKNLDEMEFLKANSDFCVELLNKV